MTVLIATDFGGNTDFCTGPLAHPVRWRKAPIPRGSYQHADGHGWAEPDLDHAVQLCRQVAERRQTLIYDPNIADPSRDPLTLAEYRNQFCFADVGNRYRNRLNALWANN